VYSLRHSNVTCKVRVEQICFECIEDMASWNRIKS